MLLPAADAASFLKLYYALLWYVNERLHVVPRVATPREFARLAPAARLPVRQALVGRLDLIASFVADNPCGLSAAELEQVSAWQQLVVGEFFIVRYLQKYAVFLGGGEPPVAYGVVGASQPVEDVVGPKLPVWVDAVLLPFQGCIVYDGLLEAANISFGPGVRRGLNEELREVKARSGIVTSLPIGVATVAPRPARSARPSPTKSPPRKAAADAARGPQAEVLRLVDQFCAEHLNEEYAVLCRRLAEKLARKRPSPLTGGRPEVWACGILRTIGWVNFLDDRTRKPHLKLTAIDKTLGVGESTGQAKSQLIRKMFKIGRFDHQWILPSQWDDHPLIWTVEVNGWPRDIRTLPREAQEIAFEKGLIPYIPADRAS